MRSFLFECGQDLCTENPSHVLARNASRVAILLDQTSVARLAYDTPAGVCNAPVAGGACKIILAHDASVHAEAAWSPDGAHLAIAMSGQLWLVDADGSNLVRLRLATASRASASSPTWGRTP